MQPLRMLVKPLPALYPLTSDWQKQVVQLSLDSGEGALQSDTAKGVGKEG